MQRKQELQNDPSLFKKNFLDLYLKEILLNKKKEIIKNEIIYNFRALYISGTDTTGNMTGVSVYYLSQIQNFKKRLEMQTQRQDPKDLFNAVTLEDLSQRPFVYSTLKESLRLIAPTAAVLGRYANKDIQIGEFQVQTGDLVS